MIYNRLQNKGETVGLLQIDAALLYGLPDHTGALTNEDKAVDTPYNLYIHKGLPPTPIANPGSTALEAAMNPNETDYYFYALGTDGRHHFSRTLRNTTPLWGAASYADKRKIPELLAPAGDMERLKMAVLYGADARVSGWNLLRNAGLRGKFFPGRS